MSRRTLRLVEAALWVAGATTLTVVGAAVPSVLFGDGLPTLKYVLFVVGLLLFGLGSFAIQPPRPGKDEQRVTVESDEAADLEAKLQQVPPLRGRLLPYEDRVSRDWKLFLTGVATLGVSLAMEVFLGIGP